MKKHLFRTGSIVAACVLLTMVICGMAPQPAMAKGKIVFGVIEPLSGVMKDVGGSLSQCRPVFCKKAK